MKIRNLVIGAVGLLSLGAVACGAQGGTEKVGSSSDAVIGASWSTISTTNFAARKFASSCAISPTKMLVTGGYESNGTVHNETYLYDLELDTWTVKDSLNTARGQAIMVKEPNDDKCLIFGGTTTIDDRMTALASVEEYDLSADQWTTKDAMGTARYNGSVSKFGGSNKWIYIGGMGSASANPLSSTEKFDPSLGAGSQRTAGPSITTGRWRHASVNPYISGSESTSVVYVVGGRDNSGVIGTAQLLTAGSPDTVGSLTALPSSELREYLTATALANGKVVVAGGRDENLAAQTEVWTYSNSNWTTGGTQSYGTAATMTTARFNHIALRLGDSSNDVLIVAGRASDNAGTASLNKSQLYVGSTATLNTEVSSANLAARWAHVAEFLAGSDLADPAVVTASGIATDQPGGTALLTGAVTQ